MNKKNQDVIISVGHKNFHMLFTASEMERRGRLSQVICGAYPTAFEQSVLNKWPLKLSKKLNRFVNRTEKFPVEKVRQSRKSEVLSSLFSKLDKLGFDREALNVFAFKMYGKLAEKYVSEAAKKGATIYHYRAGFGQSSVQVAKELGMKTICDHSIVHPSLLNLMIDLKGNYPESIPLRPKGIWGAVLDDIEVADHVVVNSDFVAETFEFMGFDSAKLSVVYLGVEDKFIHSLPATREYYQLEQARPIKFLFAGGVIPRKGVDEISAALKHLTGSKIELHLAGSLPNEYCNRYADLLDDKRVTYHGMLSQKELAKLMSESDVFLFPTRAEGSARVVFEAMAAGCAVICTHNAGSAVRDSIGGRIIPINDQQALINAVQDVLEKPMKYVEYGKANKQLILDSFRQKNYGDSCERVYK